MRQLRVHLTLLDEPPSDKQETVAFLEISAVVDDDIDLAAYAHQLNARCYVTLLPIDGVPPGTDPQRITVDLVPGAP